MEAHEAPPVMPPAMVDIAVDEPKKAESFLHPNPVHQAADSRTKVSSRTTAPRQRRFPNDACIPQDANELTGVERVHVQWRRMMMLLLAVLAVVAFVIATVGSIVALSDLPLRIRTADLDLRNEQQLQVRARARSVYVGLTRTVTI
jgi:hypothetical protein